MKLHYFSLANLLAHNNTSKICYWGQISLQSVAINTVYLTPLGVTFILLAMVCLKNKVGIEDELRTI